MHCKELCTKQTTADQLEGCQAVAEAVDQSTEGSVSWGRVFLGMWEGAQVSRASHSLAADSPHC